jgi:CRP-like cAMP-binding protein/thioredoxin reductase/Fe-S-cluster-containing hydrogenase component 2
MADYKVAIVGSGPGGLSAAAHAAELDVSHVLLESTPHISDTIYKYQKGKHVMDEPQVLPLRSPIDFSAGTRENILETWEKQIGDHKVNLKLSAEVTAISGAQGNFTVTTRNGETITAEHVVMGIGLQGNVRKLGVDGQDLPMVQYQLDDPDEYEDETIVVVGAGDAAIENAVALAKQNTVIIVNRRDEFNRAKQGNLDLISKAIKDGLIECYYSSTVGRVEQFDTPADGGERGIIVLNTLNGESEIKCHRIIARLGAIPPRRFVESCGIEFPSDDPAAVPALSAQYESNVPGLYIVGALAGYPLIKQAMNQGYEVIEFILGHDVEPADEPLLKQKFADFSARYGNLSVNQCLDLIQENVPLLSGITTLQLREFLLDSEIRTPAEGEVIFRKDDYTNTFFSIIDGEVNIQVNADDPTQIVTLRKGGFFGEMSLISGHRRSATTFAGRNCVLIETPRRSMNKLINSAEPVKREIDLAFLLRAVQANIARNTPAEKLHKVISSASLQTFKPGEELFQEGDSGDKLYLVRRGSLTVSRNVGGKEIVLSYLPAGNYVGEMALLGDNKRTATVRAAVQTETICLDGAAFKELVDQDPEVRRTIEEEYQKRLAQNVHMESAPDSGNLISFLVQQGLGEATDVLLIDESLCVRCDNCEKACAETHFGTSRLDREAGPTYASIHVPTSCRHCEHPHCMKDCPPDAIHRAPNGEVYIAENCIGCGNCKRNCPYGVIQMSTVSKKRKPGLLSWMMFGFGPGPGGPRTAKKADPDALKMAVKCDMCKDIPRGPACVRACPTGAAIRVNPVEFMSVTNLEGY